ncbi:phage major capsid protein [Litoribrevibacter albus]|uniref:Phage capsid protein n=1 Tax=Litoribrevibacter albus TaxID=1473156 RepID=A0AA37SB29_9GAMM|nr:phage major capsid protein [Litoribrevibacter albus]GLQ31658.1 phage capsid protein [Litoribrevibacter albus]
MTDVAAEIKEVTGALQSAFEEFKTKNDKRIDGVESEKSALADKVDSLQSKLKELEEIKTNLEALETKQNRIGSNHSKSPEAEAHKAGFLKFMRKGDDTGLADLEQKALNTTADADGGFAVPEELDREISSLLRDASPMRQVCRVITVSSADYKKLINKHGAATGWVGEEDSRPGTGTPQLAQVTPFMGEIYANPGATQTMLDDAFFDAEAWLSEEVRYEFAAAENTAFTSGDGLKKPKGLLAYATSLNNDATRTFGEIQHKVSGSSGVIAADDIKKFPYLMRAAYRAGASYMMNTNSLGEIMVLKDSQGNYLWRPGLEAGQPSTLGGYGLVENEDMPDIAANANAIAFGNFQRAYYIVDRLGTRALRDPFTNKPYVHFYTTKRVGGMLVDSNAVKFLKVAA